MANELPGLVAETRSTNLAVAADAGKETSTNYQQCRCSRAWYLPTLGDEDAQGCKVVDEEEDQGCKLVEDENNGQEKHCDALDEAGALGERRKQADQDGGAAIRIVILLARKAALEVDVVIHIRCQRVVWEVIFDDLEVACEGGGRSLGSHGS